MGKIIALIYGIVGFLLFNGSIFYFIGFVGNFVVPKTVDTGVQIPFAQALMINFMLIVLFGIQHSLMARPQFKQWWQQMIPEPIERSTYVLSASLLLIFLCWQWQPLPEVIWQVENPSGYWILIGLFWFGWLFSLFASFLIDQFDLLGVRQVYLYWQGKPYTPIPFQIVSAYKWIRHPIMLGTMIGLWATPLMTVGHLILAIGFTAYILIGIHFEEQNMKKASGKLYEQYQQKTSKLIPYLF